MFSSTRLLRPIPLAVALLASGLPTLAASQAQSPAQAQAQAVAFNIPAQPAATAVQRLVEQTAFQLIYSPEILRGVNARAVVGSFTPREALARMLEGSGIAIVDTGANSATLQVQNKSEVASQVLEAIVITATRRREPSREVPMQVNVKSAAELDQTGAKTLADYMAALPGVDVKTQGGTGLGAISIRGVSTGDQTIATVGTYIDDVAVGSTTAFGNGSGNALDMALLDLNHIELLRGPQGTLYGAGAMGGVLRYVTNEPDTYEFAGKASVGTSVTRDGSIGSTVSGVINVPLKEDVAGLRVSAFTDRSGGYVNAFGPAGGKDVNDGRTSGARVSLLIQPDTRWKVRLTATTQNLRREGTDYVDYDAATGRPVTGHAVRELTLREPYHLRTSVGAAEVEYDFGFARLNSITTVQKNLYDVGTDMSSIYGPLLQDAGVDAQSVGLRITSDLSKKTQEFRLTSKAGGDIDWLAGFFWNREVSTNDQVVDSTLTGGAPGPAVITAALPSTFREVAAYGDITWNASKRFSITGGLRVARNQQNYAQFATSLLAGSSDIHASSAETSKTYLLTAKYALTPTSNVYARAASGYRPGGPNIVLNDPATGLPAAPPTFKHDSLWSYEAGYKADLLDKTLMVETSVYNIRWSDMQQYFAINAINVLVNSGKANIKGAELAATWRAAPQLTLTGSLAYIDAHLSEPAVGLGANGSRLPNSARLAGSLSARYSWRLAEYPAYVGVAERFIGDRNAGFEGAATLPNYKLPAYAVTDLQAGIDFGKVQVALFLRNVFDKRGQAGGSTTFLPLGGAVLVTEERPRTAGLTVTAKY